MKKVLFVFIVFMMTLQISFAQGGRVVIIYFHNGSVVKGILSKLPNEEKFRIETPNNGFILFGSSEVKDILYEDGTRPGGATQPPRPQPQVQPQPQAQQRMEQSAQPGNNRATRVDPSQKEAAIEEEAYEDEYIEDDDFIEDDDYLSEEESDEFAAPAPKTAKASKQATQVPTQATSLDFIPGYHGIAEFGYTVGMGDSIASNRMELTITQGYQFTPSLFVGFGFGVHLYSDSVLLGRIVDINGAKDEVNAKLSYAFPVFIDVRYNILKNRKIIPYADLKLGYTIGLLNTYSTRLDDSTGQQLKRTETSGEALGLFAVPSLGVKFMLGRSLAFHLSAGYSMQVYRDDRFGSNGSTIVKTTDTMGGVTLRAGLEF
ncbi:MAG: hypothetical protein LBB84_01470 [Tannerellaceae bacterium]|jgi:hypothetical protein|nr:hypothetical protein [Tannerellaceae bacterium]